MDFAREAVAAPAGTRAELVAGRTWSPEIRPEVRVFFAERALERTLLVAQA